jgi:hypothetical protein
MFSGRLLAVTSAISHFESRRDMAGKPPDPLKASVRRALFWRVVAGTLLIAVVMALVVYGLERNRIGEAVVAYALHRASIFNDETGRLFDVPGLPDRQVIQSKLEASSGDRPDTPWGRFVLVEVYDLEGELVAAITDREYAQMEGVEKARRPSPPATATTESTYEVLRVDGLPHLQIQIPLLTSAGRQVGAIDAVFALTPEDIAASRRRRQTWRLSRSWAAPSPNGTPIPRRTASASPSTRCGWPRPSAWMPVRSSA